MTTVAHNTPEGTHPERLRRFGPDLVIGILPLFLLALPAWWLFALPTSYLTHVCLGYAALALLIVWRAPETLPRPGLGAANRVTLGRATLVLPVTALALQPAALTQASAWWIVGVSTVAMILDGVDGWVARRTGGSSFGARFDMELDSFLMLSLAALVWQSGKVGPWVVMIGMFRYAFVAAAWLWPALRATLPDSMRRKAVCVVQGVALIVCLGPVVPSAMAVVVAVGVFLTLVYSFAVDIVWLARRGG